MIAPVACSPAGCCLPGLLQHLPGPPETSLLSHLQPPMSLAEIHHLLRVSESGLSLHSLSRCDGFMQPAPWSQVVTSLGHCCRLLAAPTLLDR